MICRGEGGRVDGWWAFMVARGWGAYGSLIDEPHCQAITSGDLCYAYWNPSLRPAKEVLIEHDRHLAARLADPLR